MASILCLHYRPETVHFSTKDAYTSEISFLAFFLIVRYCSFLHLTSLYSTALPYALYHCEVLLFPTPYIIVKYYSILSCISSYVTNLSYTLYHCTVLLFSPPSIIALYGTRRSSPSIIVQYFCFLCCISLYGTPLSYALHYCTVLLLFLHLTLLYGTALSSTFNPFFFLELLVPPFYINVQ